MSTASFVRPALPARDSKIALQLGDDRLVTVGLQRVDEEGALVLSISHPDALAPGRPILVLWNRDDAWTPLPTRVATPRFRPHPDAGRLRLVPEARPVDRNSVAGRGKPDGAAATPSARAEQPAESAAAPSAAPTPVVSAEQTPAAAGSGALPETEAAPGITAWHGHHPTANVALRLGSGRVRTIEVRRIDDDGALVLSLPRPSMLSDGATIEIAWSERREWYTANVHVAMLRPKGHPDAGLLRLLPAVAPTEHKERRAALRYPIKVGIRARVEDGAVRKGTTIASESLDLSEGGVAFPCEHQLARGDTLSARVLGPSGQIGDDIVLLVRRVTPIPGRTDYRVAASFEKPSKAFERAIKRYILKFA